MWRLTNKFLEDEVFDVKFKIPVGGADEVLIVLSNMSWTEFLSNVADVIGIAPKKVSIAYCFSTDKLHALIESHTAARAVPESQQCSEHKPFQKGQGFLR